ncbi:MAG: NTP transferase domain-containing protein, partial [Candidatus Omnitrophica bacterium]|nr:NTP transferase domain-containing protein [Candidatus Omnitrophota bacterium]
MNKELIAIILAAGKGERMHSEIPKVLQPICGRAMLEYVLELVNDLKIKRKLLVLGYKADLVKKALKQKIEVVIQKELLGTADAVKTAGNLLKGFKGTLLILYGDHPLFKKETIKNLIEHHLQNKPDVTLLSAKVRDPSGYGRILRDGQGNICKIIEESELDEFQKSIKEINLGASCFEKEKLFSVLDYIKKDKSKNEYYLTKAIELLYKNKAVIETVKLTDIEQALGINTYLDLAKANRIMQMRIHQDLVAKGVRLVDPQNIFINYNVSIGEGTIIYPFTVIENDVKIGRNCSLGPFLHLREGTRLKDNVVLGNFVEVVRSKIGKKSLAKHFSYLGDALIGKEVNIGAGTVTANYDGKKKNRTVIKDKAFIGSDTVLIAPVKIGRFATTGAGSVVTKH